jgi:chromosome segregation ATPase
LRITKCETELHHCQDKLRHCQEALKYTKSELGQAVSAKRELEVEFINRKKELRDRQEECSNCEATLQETRNGLERTTMNVHLTLSESLSEKIQIEEKHKHRLDSDIFQTKEHNQELAKANSPQITAVINRDDLDLDRIDLQNTKCVTKLRHCQVESKSTNSELGRDVSANKELDVEILNCKKELRRRLEENDAKAILILQGK